MKSFVEWLQIISPGNMVQKKVGTEDSISVKKYTNHGKLAIQILS